MKKTILITGAGSGLGKELAKELFGENIIVAVGLGSKKLNALKKEIGCDIYPCDISKASAVSSLAKKVQKKYGRIDCLVNNAGVWTEGSLVAEDDKRMQKVIEVNLLGSILMSKYFLPLLSKAESGLIVNVVSQAGMYSKTNRSVYGASKWGMTGFTKYLNDEVLPNAIRVTGVYPGKMNTPLFEDSKNKKDMSDALDPRLVARTIKFIIDQPSDVHIPELGIKSSKQLR